MTYDRYPERSCGPARWLERAPQEVRSRWLVRVRRAGHDGQQLRAGQQAHQGRPVHRRVRAGGEDARVELPQARRRDGADPQRIADGRRRRVRARHQADDGRLRRPSRWSNNLQGPGLRLEHRPGVEGSPLGADPVQHQGRRRHRLRPDRARGGCRQGAPSGPTPSLRIEEFGDATSGAQLDKKVAERPAARPRRCRCRSRC